MEGESDPTSKGFQETSLSRGAGNLRDWPPALHPVCLSRDLRSGCASRVSLEGEGEETSSQGQVQPEG